MSGTLTGEMTTAPSAVPSSPSSHPPRDALSRRGFPLHRASVAVLVVGLIVTSTLAGLSRVNYLHNEERLVSVQTRLAATTLAAAPIDVQRRLGRPVSLVAATQDPDQFRTAIAASMTGAGSFASALLYRIVDGKPQLEVSLGSTPMLDPESTQAIGQMLRATTSGTLLLTRLLAPGQQRLGYTLMERGTAGTFVGYAEQALPADRRATIPASSPLAGVHFALYLGTHQTSAALLETNAGHLPLGGTRATAPVPFGDSVLTLAVSPSHSLLGRFAESVALAIAIGGLLFTLGVAFLAERLVRRRTEAEQLAATNRRLYQAQRSVAESLQHSLLPQRLPQRPDLQLAARYLPGTEGIDVGGDWYDVIDLDDDHVFFTVGDVSGRGLRAAILMASLRNSINAYAYEGHEPGAILAKVSRLINVVQDGRFATVICGRIDLASRQLTIANAGHPSPALVDSAGCTLIRTVIGPPLGIGADYRDVQVPISSRATLVAYTDGLVERRGESIGIGLERLRAAISPDVPLDQLLDDLLDRLTPGGPSDDVAVLGLRWQT